MDIGAAAGELLLERERESRGGSETNFDFRLRISPGRATTIAAARFTIYVSFAVAAPKLHSEYQKTI